MDTQAGHVPRTTQVRVRLLGGLEVTRADGSRVADHEWRTRKNQDLLRLLALTADRPVRSATLVAALWPASTRERALGSLRTAASDLRRILGPGASLSRRHDGLVLEDAWVDVTAFEELARVARRAATTGEHEEALGRTAEAEVLYRGDLHASDDDSQWANNERDRLVLVRHGMLCAAAGSAEARGDFQVALDLAGQAARLVPTSEQAQRLRMRAYARLGQVSLALTAFETYRRYLAEELSADPSAEISDLRDRLVEGQSP